MADHTQPLVDGKDPVMEMPNPFVGQASQPGQADLAAALDGAKPVWDQLIVSLAEEYAGHDRFRPPGLAAAGLRAESCFRAYVLTTHRSELTVIGHLSSRDWESVRVRVRAALAID